MLARLRAVGIDQVIAVDLTRESIGVPVARVIVPGLEGIMDDDDGDYAPGPRARRFCRETHERVHIRRTDPAVAGRR